MIGAIDMIKILCLRVEVGNTWGRHMSQLISRVSDQTIKNVIKKVDRQNATPHYFDEKAL